MPKRKFDQYVERPDIAGSASNISIHQARLTDGLTPGTAKVLQALKLARGFERQKLGRRRKIAEKEKDDTLMRRLREETEAIKLLDLLETAKFHLCKTLLKIKAIALHQDVLESLNSRMSAANPPSVASANVQARLLNSAPVKAAMNDAVDIVKAQINLQGDGHSSNQVPKHRIIIKEGNHTNKINVISQEATSRDSEAPESTAAEEKASDELDDDIIDTLENRVGGSDTQSTDSSIPRRHSWSEWSGMEDDHDSVDQSSDADPSLAEPMTVKEGTGKDSISFASAKTTTFLPALSMGGYWSGSEDDAQIDDSVSKIKIRKNKRGQRARQKIYEKKYGKNANHLKKVEQSRDHGWDARRGAQESDQRTNRRGRRHAPKSNGTRDKTRRPPARGPTSSGANTEVLGPRKQSSASTALHPSWEAAKKAKEQKKAAPFQGKKVTFD